MPEADFFIKLAGLFSLILPFSQIPSRQFEFSNQHNAYLTSAVFADRLAL
jgi:hypothetical protein